MSIRTWEFEYAGLKFPAPNSYVYTMQPIDKADRTASGLMVIEKIAMKHTLQVTYNSLDGEQLSNILVTLEENRSGKLKFYNPVKKGIDTIDVYYGAGPPVGLLLFDDELHAQRWNALTINFIEM